VSAAATAAPQAALSGTRVLDLTESYAAYAGRLLADLGADVIRIEPPGGGPLRRLAPAQTLADGSVRSFAQAFLDAGKRGITLDLGRDEGRALFTPLAERSDIIIEALAPADRDALDLGYERLRAFNPRLILVSISPFGQTGPYANYRATDLTLLAAGGLLSLGGYADTEPLAVAGEQALLGSAIFGTVAALAALVAREGDGKGAWLDVSGQECVAFALEDAVPEWYLNRSIRRRNGGIAREAGTGIYPCKDGYVSLVAGRLGTAKAFTALCAWIAESGVPDGEALREPHWQDFKHRQSPEGISRFAAIFGNFCATRGKEELYREGQTRQIAIAPVNTVADLLADAQLSANAYFRPQANPHIGRDLTFPGPPYRLSRTPARLRGVAPRVGEHNAAIYRAELGLSEARIADLAKAGVI
jgi:benzylsuccinate CoA-transferase BbsE subunit